MHSVTSKTMLNPPTPSYLSAFYLLCLLSRHLCMPCLIHKSFSSSLERGYKRVQIPTPMKAVRCRCRRTGQQARRISHDARHVKDGLKRNFICLLRPAQFGGKAFILCLLVSLCPLVGNLGHSPKKYSIKSRRTVAVVKSPNTMIGAATSPRLNSSVDAPNV